MIEEKLAFTPPKNDKIKTRDTKSLIKYIEKAISETRKGGTKIKTQQSETTNEIIFTISITK